MITLRTETLTATILPIGATLSGLWLNGHDRSLVLGSSNENAYHQELIYAGAVVGPIANRVSGAAVEIDGVRWPLPANEPNACLHGGPHGFHAQHWQEEETTQSATRLSLDLQHGDNGLPGHRRISVEYAILEQENALSVRITATTDRPTLFSPAHHPYWTLDNAPDVSGHKLEVRADSYTGTDAANLPTGQVLPVAGSDYDFRQARAIPVDRILDGNCCLIGGATNSPRMVARLRAGSGIALEINTTAPGLQIYNGGALAPGRHALHSGQVLAPFAGIALEPQAWPDAPGHPSFPQIIMNPGDTYHQHTIYRVYH